MAKQTSPPFPTAEIAAVLGGAFNVRQQVEKQATYSLALPREPRAAPIRKPRRGVGKPYKVTGSYRARRNTWTAFMVNVITAHGDVVAASNAHRASGLYPEHNLDFSWAVKVGLITWEG